MKQILFLALSIFSFLFSFQTNAKDIALEYYWGFIEKAKAKGFLYYAMAQNPSEPSQGGYGSAKSGQEAANKTAIEECIKTYKVKNCIITYIGTKQVLDINNFRK